MKLGLKRLGMSILVGAMTIGSVACSQAPVQEIEKAPGVEKDAQAETPKENKEEASEESAAFPAVIVDSTGTEVTLDKAPERIISLAPSTTEILYFLGKEDQIVGRTDYCDYPATMADVQAVGGTRDPNVETVISLNPDLVVAATHTSEEVINKLREVNIPVAFLNEQASVEGTYSAIRLMGELVGEADEAEIIIDDMKEKIDAVASKVKGVEELPKVYYMMWYGDSDSTAGGNTFIGELIRLAGAQNIAEAVEGWSISKEIIAKEDPEIIIVEEKDYMTLEEEIKTLQGMEFYKELTAVKEGNVYAINPSIISRQAPRLAEALEDLADIIHPELDETK